MVISTNCHNLSPTNSIASLLCFCKGCGVSLVELGSALSDVQLILHELGRCEKCLRNSNTQQWSFDCFQIMNAFLAFFRLRRRSPGETRALNSSGSTLTSRTELVSASVHTPSTCSASNCDESTTITPEVREQQIQEGLIGLMKSSTGLDNSRIILEQDLRELWTQDGYDDFYKTKSWYGGNINNKFMSENFLKILSILVLLNFRNWERFKTIFIDTERRTDNDLLFDRKKLQATEWLGPRDGDEFFQKQWIFCPFVIIERQKPYDETELQMERRMPFIQKRQPIGEGASAEVYMEVIAPYYLEYNPTPTRKAINKTAKAVACEVVLDKNVDSIEFQNLVSLRKCLSNHTRIMVNIATFIRQESAGKIHHILYDLAAFDLEKVFCGAADFSDHRHRLESAGVGRNGSSGYWAADLIRETYTLADALEFLHEGLYGSNKMRCAHNDLKPENVLIFFPDSSDAEEQYPIGQWKIADFGISKIQQGKTRTSQSKAIIDNHAPLKERHESLSVGQERVARGQTATGTLDAPKSREYSASRTPAKREPGRYTAPEVIACGHPQPDARKGDVWSFGCILSEVLTYAVAPDLVHELKIECEKPAHVNQRFYDVETRLVKPHVLTWLGKLSQRFSDTNPDSRKWIGDCVNIIESILSPAESRHRPEAKVIRDELQKVHEEMLNHKTEICYPPDGLGISIVVSCSRDRSPSTASNLSQSPELINALPATSQ